MYSTYDSKTGQVTRFQAGEFARHLRAFRAEHGWNQAEAARQFGLSHSRYGSIERTHSAPPLDIFLSMCMVMRKDPLNYLWGNAHYCDWLRHFRPDLLGSE